MTKSQYTTIKDLESYNFKVSTGSLVLDLFLEGGFRPGIARFGAPSEHGKTLQCLSWANEWLKKFGKNGEVYYYDTECRITSEKINQSPISQNPLIGTNFFYGKMVIFTKIFTKTF